MNNRKKIIPVDFNNEAHVIAFKNLMNAYMEHPMGKSDSITQELADAIIEGLKNHPTYLGIMAVVDDEYVGLANCFENYSTFKAQPLINIHDFIVLPNSRNMGVGKFLLDGIAAVAKQRGCCKVNLEVRHDNTPAMNLYKKVGYADCNPPMYFWEKVL